MVEKKLEKGSKYNEFDINKDGVVTDEEMAKSEQLIELENADKKEDQLRRMAWMAMLSMVILTIFLFTPFVSDDRIMALDNLLTMFYIAQAGVVATFFGSSAYMNVNKS